MRPSAKLHALVYDYKRKLITAALKKHDGNITHAARSLEVGRTTLVEWLKRNRRYKR